MIVAYIDGGARGNPGPAGFGVRIERADGTLVEEFQRLDRRRHEQRRRVPRPARRARVGPRPRLTASSCVRSDSLLLVQQMLGNYKVKHPGLQPLHAKARLLAHEIGRVTLRARPPRSQRARRPAGQRGDGRGGRRPRSRRPFGPAAGLHAGTRLDRRGDGWPAGGPSRRYEQNASGWLAVHSPARDDLTGRRSTSRVELRARRRPRIEHPVAARPRPRREPVGERRGSPNAARRIASRTSSPTS